MRLDENNLLVVLGPTASGKTALACALAHGTGGEIVSADSRQVYRGLDIGSGKDLDEYVVEGERIAYHLIDVADLSAEFNVHAYQAAFFNAFEDIRSRGRLPVLCGGTGLYIDAVLSDYRMVDVPEDAALRERLAPYALEELAAALQRLKPEQHNTTDLGSRERCIRAIEIATHESEHPREPSPPIRPLVLGTRWPRTELHARIEGRLRERMDAGLVEEVETLVARGVSHERLKLLGLEYRHVAEYLDGTIRNRNDLFQKLASAIRNFAKRQQTWFRRMERRGTVIHWIERADADAARSVVQEHWSGAGLPW